MQKRHPHTHTICIKSSLTFHAQEQFALCQLSDLAEEVIECHEECHWPLHHVKCQRREGEGEKKKKKKKKKKKRERVNNRANNVLTMKGPIRGLTLHTSLTLCDLSHGLSTGGLL